MRIGILTITPNIGFGGNLQAYALKCILENMGHQVSIIQYTKSYGIKQKFKYLLKNLYKRILRREFVYLSIKKEYEFRRQNLYIFHSKYLNFTEEINTSKKLHKLINNSFDTVVVGSDQVWRPQYVNGIENYFFKGVSESIDKIAYAASFGIDKWEFSENQTKECSNLISHFKYVSVREKSGIKLVKEMLNYNGKVYCDLDPTLLSDKSIYKRFVKDNKKKNSYIFSYILNDNHDKRELISFISRATGLPVLNFNTNAENSNISLDERIAPSIEDWITDLYHSDFIVTDSFHGCVFAIIFNKPFIVYANKNRGEERFRSLLDEFNLSDRLCSHSKEVTYKIINNLIDWNLINNKISLKRSEVYNRLKKSLQ